MGHENGHKQRPAKRRHVQGMLDETEPLRDKSRVGMIEAKYKSILLSVMTGVSYFYHYFLSFLSDFI